MMTFFMADEAWLMDPSYLFLLQHSQRNLLDHLKSYNTTREDLKLI